MFFDLDQWLQMLMTEYGAGVYAVLFLIIFIETGLVVMPFLPGDSLLFTVGIFAARGQLSISWSIALLFLAAVIGDALNYTLGKFCGERILSWKLFGRNLLQPQHLQKTEVFFAKYGPKTIFLARFVPIVRTFAPFVAGMGKMPYRLFAFWNILGGAIWVFPLTLAGYFFGNIPVVKNHFEAVILLIIFVSLLPPLLEVLWQRRRLKRKHDSKANSRVQ